MSCSLQPVEKAASLRIVEESESEGCPRAEPQQSCFFERTSCSVSYALEGWETGGRPCQEIEEFRWEKARSAGCPWEWKSA
jgi:hypothetical protein